MGKSRKKRTNVSRATKAQYNYPERANFLKALIAAGYTELTSSAFATGIVNPKGSAFTRARELWLEHMNGKPYPGSNYTAEKQSEENDTPPKANFNVNEDVPSSAGPPFPEGELTIGKMQKEWEQRLSRSFDRKQATEVKSRVHVTIKVSQAIQDILKMRERDGSTNDKLLGLIEVLLS